MVTHMVSPLVFLFSKQEDPQMQIQSTYRSLNEAVIQAQAGDEEACGFLFSQYKSYVENAAQGVLGYCPHEIEDVVAETFLRAFRRIKQLRTPAYFKSWLWKIAHNCAISRLRRPRERSLPGDSFVLVSLEAHCEQSIEDERREAILNELEQGLASLSDISRDALELFYLKELSCKEASDLLGVNVGTFRRRLHDARNELREFYGNSAA
jgi:RNA polymerase sigma-70 factor (ECF subfamily)